MIDIIEKKVLYTLKTLGLILLLITFSYIPLIVFNINLKELSYNSKIIYSLICDLLLLIIFILIYKKDIIKDFKNYFNKNIKKNLKLSLKYWLLGLCIMIASNVLISTIISDGIPQNEEIVRQLINKAPLFMIFELIIFAPITEEIIFRRSIKDIINNKNIYILVSGLFFGFMHIVKYIKAPIDIIYIIPYAALGIIFAKLYKKTDNIFSTITIHSIHNTFTLILYLITKVI